MASVITLSHKAQNPLTANDHHTMATSITTHTHTHTHTHTYSYMLSHKAQNLITRDDDQPTNQTTLLTTGLYIISTPSNLKRKEAVDQNKNINARPGYLLTTSCTPRCYSDSDNGGCQGRTANSRWQHPVLPITAGWIITWYRRQRP
jgi:hypothetical protein